MPNIFSFFSISYLKDELLRIVKRFPLSVLLIVMVSGIFAYQNHMGSDLEQGLANILENVIITGIITFFLSISVVLFLESRGVKSWIIVLLSLCAVVVFGILFYSNLGENPFSTPEGETLIFQTFAGFFAFVFCAPFISTLFQKDYPEDRYTEYFTHMSTTYLFSIIVGWLLWALGSIALWSIETLFDIASIDSVTYGYWAIIALSFSAPLFGLSRIPSREKILEGEIDENLFFTFIVKFVALPFLVLYFLILYAYSIDVLVHFQDWPKWQVSWMVIGFSMFGYIAYIFSYALSEKGNLIDLIRRSFPWAVLPQILMLFYAIYLRIHQYDITINRYFVVIFGFWLTGISLYYALAREKRLMWITISLAFMIVLISFGPWSVFSLPLHRQYDRLVHQLEQAQILSGSTITPLVSYDSITADLSSDLYMGIGYVCQFQECALVKRLFAKELEAALQKQATDWEASESKYRACRALWQSWCSRDVYTEKLTSWEIQRILAESLHVRMQVPLDNAHSEYISLSRTSPSVFPIDTTGYTEIVNILSGPPTVVTPDAVSVEVDPEKHEVTLRSQSWVLEVFPASEFFTTLAKKSAEVSTLSLTPEELTVSLSGKIYDIKVIISTINIENVNYTGEKSAFPSGYVSGYALIRKK